MDSMTVDNDFFPPFSKQEMERRHRNVREFMKKDGLDCLVVYGAYSMTGNDTGHVNAMYLANYAGAIQTYIVFPLNDEPTLLVSFAYHIPNAKELSVIKDIRCPGFDIQKGVGERLKELGLEKGNIGIVGPAGFWFNISLPVEHHNYLTTTFPQANFKVVTRDFINLTLVKSEEEIRHLERGAVMTDLAQEAVFLATKPGVRHSDLRKIIADVANDCGGHFPFSHVSSTPMANPQQFYPDFFPTHRAVQAGDVVMTEISIGEGIYFGKIFGTYFVGEPTKEYQKLFEVASSVHDKTLKELKPGSTGRDVQKLAQPIAEAGYTTGIVLIGGWSTYNHPPYVGQVEGAFGGLQDPALLDYVFRTGECIGIMSYPCTRDFKKGVWVGTTCVFTEDRLRPLHKYPASELRVIEV